VQNPLPSILIVDEDPEARRALTQAAGRSGFAVEVAVDGVEALAKLGRNGFGLVVADLKMNGLGGVEALRAFKRACPRVPVIVTSAEATVSGAVAAMQSGAADYLIKPFDPGRLLEVVRRALGTAAAVPPMPGSGGPHPARKNFVTQDPGLRTLLELAGQVARTPATVLIQGESGTGKEVLAAHIHRHSAAPEAPYVAVNCAALPETLAESELFGHERGAFTGAVSRKVGKFELAKKGTLVLDEIGEMSPPLQAKLLRVLQERQIDRVGGTLPVAVEARVVAITNRDLSAAVAAGSFREDLYYRINVVPLVIPPLRERPGDIPLLARHFVEKFCLAHGAPAKRLAEEAVAALLRHGWKGNVRELENCIERAVILAEADTIQARHLNLAGAAAAPARGAAVGAFGAGTTVWEMERRLIMGTLSEVNQNRTRAAEQLGISIRTLRNKLREYREGAAACG
jgi:two-component system response regulator FlrC